MRILLSILLVLMLVPGWSGEPRLPMPRGRPQVIVTRVALDADDPSRTRVGALDYLEGWQFSARDPAFGGYSALSIVGDRFTLLSDGGLTIAFTLGADRRPRDFAFAMLPDGPDSGWGKIDRDSESLARDPATGRLWVGFERVNQIWRYAPGFTRAEAHVAPREMAKWPGGTGAETLVRLRSGRFLVLSEGAKAGRGALRALAFTGDPTAGGRSFGFAYVPPRGFQPTDAAELDDGRLLIVNRRARLKDQFTAKLTVIDLAQVRPGARIVGREIAALVPPLIHDNFEGVAVTREGRDTIVWLVSDDNQEWFQRSLLLKFRLRPSPIRGRPAAPGGEAGR